MQSENILIRDLTELSAFTSKFAEKITPLITENGLTIGLQGDLGAGKTTFVKQLVAALGSNDDVSSPSYVLENIYKTDQINIKHWDLYRLKTSSALEDLYELPKNKELLIVEWPERDPELLKSLNILIRIEIEQETLRKFIINKY